MRRVIEDDATLNDDVFNGYVFTYHGNVIKRCDNETEYDEVIAQLEEDGYDL